MSDAKKPVDGLKPLDNHASGAEVGTTTTQQPPATGDITTLDNHASGEEITTLDNHASSPPPKP
ncbi:sigma-like protein [Streptomyces liangshanensis]|uniref:sigma-like protein n=1 Tax=Streptomyces liangshanensis TaxID=2717324 RepID=UPI0036DA67D7